MACHVDADKVTEVRLEGLEGDRRRARPGQAEEARVGRSVGRTGKSSPYDTERASTQRGPSGPIAMSLTRSSARSLSAHPRLAQDDRRPAATGADPIEQLRKHARRSSWPTTRARQPGQPTFGYRLVATALELPGVDRSPLPLTSRPLSAIPS